MSRLRSLSGFGDPLGLAGAAADPVGTLFAAHDVLHMHAHEALPDDRSSRAQTGRKGSDDAAGAPAPGAGDVATGGASNATDATNVGNTPDAPARAAPIVDVATGPVTGNAPSAPATTDNAPSGTSIGTHGNHHTPPTTLYVEGTDQADNLLGSYGADEVHGRGGNDTIESASGDDKLFGEEGNDTLDGGTGNDILDGGAGNDTLRGGQGADTLIGGEGMDNVSYVMSSTGVMLDLATGGITNDAAGDTYSGIENVFGTSYSDIINGDGQANVLHGNSGDDFVFGQGGDDRIFGDLGNDILRGGAGNDILNGGLGKDRLTGDDAGQFGYDTFVMRPGTGVDIVTDFQRGYDKIDLRAYGITDLGWDGELAVGPTSTWTWVLGGLDGNEKLVFDHHDSTLYKVTVAWDDYDQDFYVSSATPIVTLQGVTDLSGSDLILV